MSYPERTVVTGAGLAGFRTVEELRRRGYSGQLTLIGAEDRPPYDRPPLSKRVLTDGIDPSLKADFASLDVDFRPGETAVALAAPAAPVPPAAPAPPAPASPATPDPAAHTPAPAQPDMWPAVPPVAGSAGHPSDSYRDGVGVLITNRDKYPFGNLVLATGSVPVTLPGPGPQRVLRTYDDALALRALLRPGLRLAIVGAGWIGAELATAAAAAGCQVTVVEAGPAPLAGALGAAAGARTAPWYEQAGVELRTSTAVESVEPGGLALAGGWLAADEIVTAVGVRPAVSWLAGSGLALDNGVAVDPGLRASLPGVYAAGDCASFESLRFGVRLRVEHWETALHAPEVVAANILGGAEVYDPVPYFWSEQFGRMVQYAGHHAAADRLLWRGDPDAATWSACWLAGDTARLTAVLTVNRPRDLLQGRRLIAAGAEADAARLADPAIAIKDAAG
jgi:3-phenylpropionate/trans-cinnamate dioxygenase ferredoxin reductase component